MKRLIKMGQNECAVELSGWYSHLGVLKRELTTNKCSEPDCWDAQFLQVIRWFQLIIKINHNRCGICKKVQTQGEIHDVCSCSCTRFGFWELPSHFEPVWCRFQESSSNAFLFLLNCWIWCYQQNARCLIFYYCLACLIAGSRCMLVWPFKPNLVIHSLPPWTPGSLCASQQGSALPPTCLHAWNTALHAENIDHNIMYSKAATTDLRSGALSHTFRFFSAILSYISLCPHHPSPQLPSLLPDLSSLPSCPLTASCSGSYHSTKYDTVSAQSNQH